MNTDYQIAKCEAELQLLKEKIGEFELDLIEKGEKIQQGALFKAVLQSIISDEKTVYKSRSYIGNNILKFLGCFVLRAHMQDNMDTISITYNNHKLGNEYLTKRKNFSIKDSDLAKYIEDLRRIEITDIGSDQKIDSFQPVKVHYSAESPLISAAKNIIHLEEKANRAVESANMGQKYSSGDVNAVQSKTCVQHAKELAERKKSASQNQANQASELTNMDVESDQPNYYYWTRDANKFRSRSGSRSSESGSEMGLGF